MSIHKVRISAEEYNCLINGCKWMVDRLTEDGASVVMIKAYKRSFDKIQQFASTGEGDCDLDTGEVFGVIVRMTNQDLQLGLLNAFSWNELVELGYDVDYAEAVFARYRAYREEREEKKNRILEEWVVYRDVHEKPIKKRFAEEIGEPYYLVCESIREAGL